MLGNHGHSAGPVVLFSSILVSNDTKKPWAAGVLKAIQTTKLEVLL